MSKTMPNYPYPHYPYMVGTLVGVTISAASEIKGMVEYAQRYPQDAGYAHRQLLLIADRLMRAEDHAKSGADAHDAREPRVHVHVHETGVA